MRATRWRPRVLEALAAAVVLAAATTVVAPDRFRPVGDRRVAADSDLDALGAALETYRHDVGEYPTTADGLAALVRTPASRPWNCRGPYVLAPIPTDPWRHAYVYRRDEDGGGEGYVPSSYGADRKPGGTGDGADVTVRR